MIKAVNGGKVIFNLYGDIKQHFEGKSGIDDWKQFRKIVNFEVHELQENYRNASEITEFCNDRMKHKSSSLGCYLCRSEFIFCETYVTRTL